MSAREFTGTYFAFNYDSKYGVGSFERLSDGATTYLETGTDCQDVRRQFRRLAQKTASPSYPNTAPSFADVFDSIASEYTYHV